MHQEVIGKYIVFMGRCINVNCDVRPDTYMNQTEQEAIEAWNRRAVPTGHWVYDNLIENWVCSECGQSCKTMGYAGTSDYMAEHFKYCNHCGAKMEQEDK